MPNYRRGEVKRNNIKEYVIFFDKRQINFINHYGTKTLISSGNLNILAYPHTWRQGDKFYKLASLNYNNFRFWWIIALVNNVATEADLRYGDTILIPVQVDSILSQINSKG